MEDLIQEKVTQKENELNATYDERIRNYEERYVSMTSASSGYRLRAVAGNRIFRNRLL